MKRGSAAGLDTPLACLLALAAVLILFTVLRLHRVDFDPSAFVVAGDRYSNPREVPRGLLVLKESDGYDGQFYFRLALDPSTSKITDRGITLDNPAYRHQRLMYPLIVRLASLGDDRLIPMAMIGINAVFFCMLAWIAGHYAQTFDRHALWGLLIVLHPGFWVSYSRDLVEIVEMTFLLGSLLSIRRQRPVWATVLLTLAVLTRETSILVAAAAAIAWMAESLRNRPPRYGWYYFVAPIVAWCSLQLALFIHWGRFPVRAGGSILANVPLEGFTDSLPAVLPAASSAGRIQIIALSFLVLCSLGFFYQLFRTKAESLVMLGFLLYGGLVASVGPSVWAEDLAFLRVFTQFYVLGTILVLASESNVVAVLLSAVVGVTWLAECCRLVLQT